MSMGWIGVDLDGTLAHYVTWEGELVIGKPITPMVARVKLWRKAGKEVRIFTARISANRNPRAVRKAIEAWCKEHIGEVLPITNVKDYAMLELWDDRAVQVHLNRGIPVVHDERRMAELRQLSELLLPFALLYKPFMQERSDLHPVFAVDGSEITVGDLRKAIGMLQQYGVPV